MTPREQQIIEDHRRRAPMWAAFKAVGVSLETQEKLRDRSHYSATIASCLDAWHGISDDPLAEWLVRLVLNQDEEIESLRSRLFEQVEFSPGPVIVDGGGKVVKS